MCRVTLLSYALSDACLGIAGGEIGWFPCQYVERRGAAADRSSVRISIGGGGAAAAAAAAAAAGDDTQAAARPDSERELPLHAQLSHVSFPSAADAAPPNGDDLEAEVALLVAAMHKSSSPFAALTSSPPHAGSSRASVASRPSSDSRGSIDRALLLSVVGPACSVSQSSPQPPVPEAGGDDAGGDAECSAVQEPAAAAAAAAAAASDLAASDAAPDGAVASTAAAAAAAARPPAARNALEFKWMLWTGSACDNPTPNINTGFAF